MDSVQFIVLGANSSGKSALVERFTRPSIVPEVSPTIGINVISSMFRTDTTVYRTKFYDMAGGAHYDSLYNSYIFNSDCAIVVFDTTSLHSFDRAKTWIDRVRSSNGENAHIALMGNKVDLESARTVHTNEVRSFIRQSKMKNIVYSEVSALTGEGTANAFRLLVNFTHKPVREVYSSVDFSPNKQTSRCSVM